MDGQTGYVSLRYSMVDYWKYRNLALSIPKPFAGCSLGSDCNPFILFTGSGLPMGNFMGLEEILNTS